MGDGRVVDGWWTGGRWVVDGGGVDCVQSSCNHEVVPRGLCDVTESRGENRTRRDCATGLRDVTRHDESSVVFNLT